MANKKEQLGDLSPEQKRALLETLLRKKAARERAQGAGAIPRRAQGEAPLSFAQERLWFLDQLEPGNPAYNVPAAARLSGPLDVAQLERALQRVIDRHEGLRTVFPQVEGRPVQQVLPSLRLPIQVEPLTSTGDDARREIDERLDAESRLPFDLATGPLLRVRLFRLSAQEHVVCLVLHHIVTDGWSQGILFRELADGYRALTRGETPELPPLTIQYTDFAAWQRANLPSIEGQVDFWRRKLGGSEGTLDLATDFPRPTVQRYRGGRVPVSLPASTCAALRTLAQREGLTPFMVAGAAFHLLLHRYTGQADLSVGTPIAGRTRPELEPLVGFFVNTVVLRMEVDSELSGAELLRRFKETALEAFANQDLPFEKLVEELRPQRDLSRPPLFQVLFAMETEDREEDAPTDGLRLTGLDPEPETAKFDLSLHLTDSPQGLSGSLEFSSDLFRRSTAERIARHYVSLLTELVRRPETRVSQLALMSAAERQLEERGRNETKREYRRGLLHEAIEERAARNPDAVAVECEGEVLTYGELEARANQVAQALRKRGVGPEERVGVLGQRSVELVVALLGVVKAGGAYVPLEPTYPEERLGYMVEDSGAKVVLAAGVERRGELGGVEVLGVAETRGESAKRVESGVGEGNLAYAIYTSGSTGKPKLAGNAHAGIVNRLEWMQEAYGLQEADVVLQKTPFSFDVSVWEFFWPLREGAKLLMAKPEGHKDAGYLKRVMEEGGVTTVHFVPSMLRAFLEEGEVKGSALKRVMSSGEALPYELVEGFYEKVKGATLHNLYGPTEAAVDVSFWECATGGERRVPIGKPIGNVTLHVLDRELQVQPVGVPGELYIGGVAVGRGYLGRPELTAEKFVPDPYGEGGARLYRTGDLVKRLEDGALEYLGRLDQQVKVRGFRIELGEIEAAVKQAAGVKDAAVVAREMGGEKRLVAYWVGAEGSGDDVVAGLKGALAKTLPEYMVPGVWMRLEALPLSSNGKLDRKALPAPELTAAAEYVAPRTPVEELIAQTWRELLQVEQVGVHDNFFDLGGHSLLATQLASRLRRLFPVELSVRAVFEAPTVSQLAERIEAGRPGVALPPLVPRPRGPAPLSFAQERMWFLERLAPGESVYHVPTAVRLTGELDVSALGEALTALVARHEILRTVLTSREGGLWQEVQPEAPVPLPLEDLSDLLAAAREQALQARVDMEANAPFDLERGPLLRGRLVRLGVSEHVLLLTLHHVITDGWSGGIFFAELAELYRAAHERRAPRLPPLTLQYGDFAHWQREAAKVGLFEQQLAYWRAALEGAPAAIDLPFDFPRPALQRYQGGRREAVIPRALLEGLRSLGQREGATLFMVLEAAFQVLLHRYSGQTDVSVGTPIAGRNHAELEPLIGLFVNTVVLRAKVDPQRSFRELLGGVRQAALDAYANQDLPFEKLVEELRPQRDLSRSPLFQVMFALQNAGSGEGIELPGVRVSPLEAEATTAKFDLNLSLSEVEDGLLATLEFSSALFRPSTIDRMLAHYVSLLTELVRRPETRVSQLSLMSAAERQLEERGRNETAREYRRGLLHEAIEERAARNPDAVAVECEGEVLTYGELEARANQVAQALRKRGVGPEERVGVLGLRSADLVVALLGVVKAGGAYVPLEPTYPEERLGYMVEDSGAKVVLAAGVERRGELGGVEVLGVAETRGESRERVESGVREGNLAYAIYTSGSTGKPKLAGNAHAGIVNRLEWMQEAYGLQEADVVLQKTPFSFDVSVWEFFWPLREGAKLLMAKPEGHKDAGYLKRVMEEGGVTTVHFVPSMLRAFLEEGEVKGSALKRVMSSGEALPYELVEGFYEKVKGATLHNLYGPTEAAVDVSFWECATGGERRVPIGKPIGNVTLHVLDRELQVQPVGVPGELYIGGVAVGRGYLGRPEMTAEKFVPDPYGERGSRLYRTGDLVKRLEDGALEYLGRLDQQVKVRGFRIELGEIEAAMKQAAGVKDAAVVAREMGGEKRLVAYWVGAEGSGDDVVAGLKAALAKTLPEYMVPGVWMRLEALPLSSNGKLDRKALPAPELTAAAEYVAPRTPVEELIAQTWRELLQVEQVGVHDNFFELGGHSLLATRVLSRLEARLGMTLALEEVFSAQTVAALAARITASFQAIERPTTGPRTPLVPLRPEGSQPPLFCVHPALGSTLAYVMLSRLLPADQPVFGLQAPELYSSLELGSVQARAEHYLEAIRRQQPRGPYRLAGYSSGGIVAYELARLLEAGGAKVEFLGILDVPAPAPGHQPLPDEAYADPAHWFANNLLSPAARTAFDQATSTDARELFLVEELKQLAILAPSEGRADLARVLRAAVSVARAVDRYAPLPYAGKIHVFATEETLVDAEAGLGWGRMSPGAITQTFSGNHFNLMTPPQVRHLAEALAAALAQLPAAR